MQKADLAFEGVLSDGAEIQVAREATKDGMWHYRVFLEDKSEWITWVRLPEYLDDMITEQGLLWSKILLTKIPHDKIRLPE